VFDQMVSDLKNGIIPESSLLRRRFEVALIKKIGVIRTPYTFWPADKKINPYAKELLWAAILLQDKENYKIVEAIISSELEEQQRTKRLQNCTGDNARELKLTMQNYIAEFIALAPSEPFKKTLQQKLQTIGYGNL